MRGFVNKNDMQCTNQRTKTTVATWQIRACPTFPSLVVEDLLKLKAALCCLLWGVLALILPILQNSDFLSENCPGSVFWPFSLIFCDFLAGGVFHRDQTLITCDGFRFSVPNLFVFFSMYIGDFPSNPSTIESGSD